MGPSYPRYHQRTELSGGQIGLIRNARLFRCENVEAAPMPRGYEQRIPAEGSEVKNMAVTGCLSLTSCGSGADGVGSTRFSSHGASLAGDAMVSESVSALGSVSTSRKQGVI